MKASKHQTGPLIVPVCVHVCVPGEGGVGHHVHMLVCGHVIVGARVPGQAWICGPLRVISCVLYLVVDFCGVSFV